MKKQLTVKSAIWLVCHYICVFLTMIGIIGHRFTGCHCLDKEYDGRQNGKWEQYRLDNNIYSIFSTDQGNLIICHGTPEGDLVVNWNLPIELFGELNNITGSYMLLSCFTGKDYFDDKVVLKRVNKKPFRTSMEWNYRGDKLFAYSNKFMHILTEWSGVAE